MTNPTEPDLLALADRLCNKAIERHHHPTTGTIHDHEIARSDLQSAITTLQSQLATAQAKVRELEKDAAANKLTKLQRECLRIGEEVQRAAGELPDGYKVVVCIEKGVGWVELEYPDYSLGHFSYTVNGLSHCITQAISAALAKETS